MINEPVDGMGSETNPPDFLGFEGPDWMKGFLSQAWFVLADFFLQRILGGLDKRKWKHVNDSIRQKWAQYLVICRGMEHPENHKYIIQDINSIPGGETMFLRKNMPKKKTKTARSNQDGRDGQEGHDFPQRILLFEEHMG